MRKFFISCKNTLTTTLGLYLKIFRAEKKKRRKILSSSKNTLNATLGLYLRIFRGKKYPAKIPYFMQKYLKYNPRVVFKEFSGGEKKRRKILISSKNTLNATIGLYLRTFRTKKEMK